MQLLRSPIFSRVSPARSQLFIFVSLLLILVFWQTRFVYPVKVFVVFLHEMSHAAAALFTGGAVERISLDVYEGGSCDTIGGSRLTILNAGYFGSILWGGFLLIIACRTTLDRPLTFLVGATLLIVTVRYVESDFGKEFGYAASVFGMVSAVFLPALVCEAILTHLGMTSCLYTLFDIVSDVFYRSVTHSSDAELLSDATGIPSVVWGVVWLLVSAWATLFFVRVATVGLGGGEEIIGEVAPSSA